MKKLIVISLLICSPYLLAKNFILKKEGLKCTDTKTKKPYTLKSDVLADLSPSECLDIPWTLQMNEPGYINDNFEGKIEVRNTITFRIAHRTLEISCHIDQGQSIKRRIDSQFLLKENVVLKKAISEQGSYLKGNGKTIKDWNKMSPHNKFPINLRQKMKLNIQNGKIGVSDEVLKGEKSFAYYTDPDSKQRIYWFLDKKSYAKNKSLIKPEKEEENLNYVSSLSCGDHQVGQPNMSDTDDIKGRHESSPGKGGGSKSNKY